MSNALLSTVNAARQRQPMCGECEKSLPNQIVFDKIESIIRLMQDEQNGLPVKTAKSFMSKIPSVFTGIDLINWMMRNLKLDDNQEAVHLANLIASHGYIFPIEDHTLSIKYDGTFYRFQTPCLWPSNNSDPENTDYAVYLCKRTMQGKTRLELADYEAENLARLQKMFSRKWEFIFMQAESQAKVDKKRDKLERKVLDSQERAFWDVYRPVPGCVNTTELDIKKACRLSKSAKRCSECKKVAVAIAKNAIAPSPDISSTVLEVKSPEPPVSVAHKIVQIVEDNEKVEKLDRSENQSEELKSDSGSQQEGGGSENRSELASDTIQLTSGAPKGVDTKADTRQKEAVKSGQSDSSKCSQQQASTKGIGGHHHHQHQHHHHHHHHHHPHSHSHSHHHHHRQCPHHKHHQHHSSSGQQQVAQQQLSIPTESMLTSTIAASALTMPNNSQSDEIDGDAVTVINNNSETSNKRVKDRNERQFYSEKRSVGSVDQFMRTPSLQSSSSSRRKSECNRMLSMIESPSVGETETLGENIDELVNIRPASACCSFSNLEKGQKSSARSTQGQSGLQQSKRKSSLNILPGQEGGSSAATWNSSSQTHKQHSQLKGSHSICPTIGSSSSELTIENQSIGDLERELESLKIRLDRRIVGVKMSKVTQSYLSYFKQWAEYDPFIVQPIPSNPWISDSTELWESERQTKDVHCRRVRRWAFSLKELLNDPAGREQFHKFLEKEFSAENLKFWDAVQELKRVHSKDVARRVEAIWTEYLAQDANCPINIDSKSYETSKRNMAKNKNNRYIFDEAAGHVYQLMKNDSYPRYLRSDMYKDYKEASEKKRTNQVAFDVFKPQITTLKHKFNF